MNTSAFLGYIAEPDLHDGIILRVEKNGDELRVLVKAYDGRLHVITFLQVHSAEMHGPEGMMLYSLSEMTADPPYRRFEFTNWEEDDDRFLRVLAKVVVCCVIEEEKMD